jgi:hypothetical protein
VPLPGDPQRSLQLIDLGEQLKPKGPELVLVEEGQPKPPPAAPDNTQLIAFVRAFVQPPLKDGDDVQVLGGRWLAVLARPEQGAAAEQLVQQARQRRDEVIAVGVTLAHVDSKEFDRLLAPLLPAPKPGGPHADVRQAVLDAAATATLREQLQGDKVELAQTPTVATRPLEPAFVSHIKNFSYVKDFSVSKTNGAFVAEPVIGTVSDGVRIDLVAAFTGKDHIAVLCRLANSDLVLPIPKFSTTLAGSTLPVTIELPEVRTIHLQQTADLPPGSSTLVAAPKADGTWLVALVQATVQKK